jgi:2-iminobutanoate/2-iminopropanoate deaminase
MVKEVIIMPDTAEYPFSSAVKAGNFVFVSGNGGHVGKDGEKVLGIKAQTRQCLENIKQVLEAAGSSLCDVVKTTIFITDIDDFTQMNEIYKGYFTKDRPARSTVVTGLVNPDMLIEVECVAYKP